MHEGAHHNLHVTQRKNWLLGVLSSCLFPMAFTLYEHTHHTHHRGNRTDHEMFDCYYQGDNMLVKYWHWYGILAGFHWFNIPTGSLLMAVYPKIFKTKIFKRAKVSEILFDDFGPAEINRIRLEVLFSVIYWIAIWNLLGLQWQAVAVLYAFFAFNWSTRQYLTHAFTPRDVINGAVNLKVNGLHQLLLLNGNWDLVHHQHPHLPWTELPKYSEKSAAPVDFWRQYWAMWKGLEKSLEPAPMPISREEYYHIS